MSDPSQILRFDDSHSNDEVRLMPGNRTQHAEAAERIRQTVKVQTGYELLVQVEEASPARAHVRFKLGILLGESGREPYQLGESEIAFNTNVRIQDLVAVAMEGIAAFEREAIHRGL